IIFDENLETRLTMPKQRTEQVWKNFKKVCGLWKENEIEKTRVKPRVRNNFFKVTREGFFHQMNFLFSLIILYLNENHGFHVLECFLIF
ncbi:MAG: hypothetical protein QGF89_01595, partial [Candidatus Marinimicrobia bacterium]|nr:hypothetical protein [Candidatus Neomarinimicrobiota bacterium]